MDRPTLKETILKVSPVSSSLRYTYACGYCFFSSKHLHFQPVHFFLCSLLNSFVSPSVSLISLPAAFPLIMSYQASTSSYSVIINYIPLSLSRLLSCLPHTASSFNFCHSHLSLLPFCLFHLSLFFSPSHNPTGPSFHHVSFIRQDCNSWCKCQGETMLKVSMFVCAVADLITD